MGDSTCDAKDELRRTMREKILSMSEEQKKDKSLKIIHRLKGLEEFSKARCIMIYVSKDDEVDTTRLIEETLRSGKRVVTPVVDLEKKELIPYEISSLEELSLGTFGVMEPKPGDARRVDVDEIDLVIVPGRAFDKDCNRLGRGGGYFDRFLRRLSGRRRLIGLAFSEQVLDRIPVGRGDVKVDAVVTESTVIRRGAWLGAKTGFFTTRMLVVSSLFTAVFIVLSAVPASPILGVPGGKFTLSSVLPALYSVLLGPVHGTIVVLLGAVLSFTIKPPVFLFLDFLSPVTNALIAGLLWRRKTWLALFTYIVALTAFITGPFTLLTIHATFFEWSVDLPFHWLHVLAIPVSLVSVKLGDSKKEVALWTRFFGCALMGTMGQHSVGSTLFEYVLGLIGGMSREFFVATWYTVFWVYPVERIIFALTSTMIGVPLIRALSRVPELGQKPS